MDADLASIYGVPTKRLNEAVKRNADRFPDGFLFRLTSAEKEEVVANCDHLTRLKFSPQLPHAFTLLSPPPPPPKPQIGFHVKEEAGLSTVAVAGRARAAFDIERVTKAFYRNFDTHRKDFLKFIDGISPSPPVRSTSSKRGTARNS